MSDKQQLISELIVKGFLPLAMVCALMYGAYTILDRQMTNIEVTQKSIIDRVVSKLDKIDANTAAMNERSKAFGQKLFDAVQGKLQQQAPTGTTSQPAPHTQQVQ